MAYIATKPVRFDRPYSIGENIPDAVVDPARAPKLQEMGLIQAAPKEAADGPVAAQVPKKKAAPKK